MCKIRHFPLSYVNRRDSNPLSAPLSLLHSNLLGQEIVTHSEPETLPSSTKRIKKRNERTRPESHKVRNQTQQPVHNNITLPFNGWCLTESTRRSYTVRTSVSLLSKRATSINSSWKKRNPGGTGKGRPPIPKTAVRRQTVALRRAFRVTGQV